MQDSDVRQVAWIRVGALGDLLVGLAALVATFERFPQAKVWVVGNPLWLQILQPGFYPQINGLLIVENGKSTRAQKHELRDGAWQPVGSAQSLRHFFRDCQATVNLRIDSFRYAWPSWLARVPIRLGSAPLPGSILYTECASWLGKDPLIHEREAALRVLGRHDRWTGLPAVKTLSSTRAQELCGLPAKTYVALNPTASRREKAWAPDRFYDLAVRLSALGISVISLAAPHESEWLERATPPGVPQVKPENLQDLIDVVGSARLLVTNTSSLQFVAATTGTQTLTLMGRARPEIWGPLGAEDHYLKGELSGELPPDIFAQEIIAFDSLSVATVFDKVRGMLR